MIYTTDNTFRLGNPVKRVVDANGFEYDYCTRVDTETGEIEQLVKDSSNEFIQDGNGNHKPISVRAAPPIVVEFYRDGEVRRK